MNYFAVSAAHQAGPGPRAVIIHVRVPSAFVLCLFLQVFFQGEAEAFKNENNIIHNTTYIHFQLEYETH